MAGGKYDKATEDQQKELLRHEMVHVYQYERLCPSMLSSFIWEEISGGSMPKAGWPMVIDVFLGAPGLAPGLDRPCHDYDILTI